MRPQIVTIYAFALLIFNGGTMLAQSSKGTNPPPPPDERTPPELFIDERLIWLLLAGLIYGAIVAYRRGQFKGILG